MILTDAKIRATKPNGKTFRLKDGDGLHLVVRPNGSRHWQLRYRFLEKEKTLSFGKYPRVTLAEARDKRIDALRGLDSGIDPSAQRQREKVLAIFHDRNSFGAVAGEWFERNRENWTPKHARDTWSRLENNLLSELGNRPIAEILPLEILTVIQKIEARKATHMAHRVLQIASSVFNYSIITGRVTHNKTIGLNQALKPHRKKHYPTLRSEELGDFLMAFESLNAHPQNKLAFRILLFTAVRTGELRFSRWSDIDLEKREWRLRAEITKMRTEHLVPLSDQVVGLFCDLHKLTGHQEWLFPTVCGYRHEVMCENTINDMIKRMGYKGRIVGHGFRSLFSTVLNENGFNRDAIERQLAHMERNAVRAAYNRAEYKDERRKIMEWWAEYMESAMPSNLGTF